jgi:hypothetical protein
MWTIIKKGERSFMRINTKIVLEKVETRVEILNRKFRQGTIEKYYTILNKKCLRILQYHSGH